MQTSAMSQKVGNRMTRSDEVRMFSCKKEERLLAQYHVSR